MPSSPKFTAAKWDDWIDQFLVSGCHKAHSVYVRACPDLYSLDTIDAVTSSLAPVVRHEAPTRSSWTICLMGMTLMACARIENRYTHVTSEEVSV